jgi:hypothetical protein
VGPDDEPPTSREPGLRTPTRRRRIPLHPKTPHEAPLVSGMEGIIILLRRESTGVLQYDRLGLIQRMFWNRRDSVMQLWFIKTNGAFK